MDGVLSNDSYSEVTVFNLGNVSFAPLTGHGAASAPHRGFEPRAAAAPVSRLRDRALVATSPRGLVHQNWSTAHVSAT
jgi:hypothetical protein